MSSGKKRRKESSSILELSSMLKKTCIYDDRMFILRLEICVECKRELHQE
jgi:hypothetical protein